MYESVGKEKSMNTSPASLGHPLFHEEMSSAPDEVRGCMPSPERDAVPIAHATSVGTPSGANVGVADDEGASPVPIVHPASS